MKLVRVGLNESGFEVILLSLLGLKATQSQAEIKGAATSSPTWVLIIKIDDRPLCPHDPMQWVSVFGHQGPKPKIEHLDPEMFTGLCP